MALQDILKRILDEAADEVKKIEADIEKKKGIFAAESKTIEQQEAKKMDEKTQKALKSMEEKTLSMARRENSKDLLKTKHKLISKTLEKFLESLENADEKVYGQILEKLFEKVQITSGKVLTPPRRLEITSKFAPQGFDVVAHKDIEGGFIIRSGDTEVDNSFKTLVFSEFYGQLTLYFADELKLT